MVAAQPHQTRLLTRPRAPHIVHPVVPDAVTRVVYRRLVARPLSKLEKGEIIENQVTYYVKL